MDNKQAAGLLKHHIKAWEGKFPSAHFEACKVAIEALTADKDEQAGRIMRYDTALRQAKEALKYCAISACKPAQGVVESQIRAIDALLGGAENGSSKDE